MKIVDRLCILLGCASAILIAAGLLYVCAKIGFTGEMIGPPNFMFIGLFGVMAAMLIYGATHLIKGDL